MSSSSTRISSPSMMVKSDSRVPEEFPSTSSIFPPMEVVVKYYSQLYQQLLSAQKHKQYQMASLDSIVSWSSDKNEDPTTSPSSFELPPSLNKFGFTVETIEKEEGSNSSEGPNPDATATATAIPIDAFNQFLMYLGMIPPNFPFISPTWPNNFLPTIHYPPNNVLFHAGGFPPGRIFFLIPNPIDDFTNREPLFAPNLSYFQSNCTKKTEFVCQLCQRIFNKSHHLANHVGSHTDEIPHSCDICYKRFRRQDHLRSHRFIHTTEKPFTCDICGKGFCQAKALRVHRVRHHKRLAEEAVPQLLPFFPPFALLTDPIPNKGNPSTPLDLSPEM